MTARRRLWGLMNVDESIDGRDVRVLGVLVWRTRYLARTVEGRLFGRLRLTERDYYPYKISALMYAHNAGQSIAAAIDSVLAQTFSDFELIVVNDASSDNTASIVRGYTDPRVLLADNARPLGRQRSLLVGFDLCRGEYIALVEPGLVTVPDCFARQMACIGRSAAATSQSENTPLCRTREEFRKEVRTLQPDDVVTADEF